MPCDLLSGRAAVLERNVSPQVAAAFKRTALECATTMVAGAVWPSAQPPAAMLAAYRAAPGLAAMRLDVAATVREVLRVLIAGLLVRASR